MVGDGKIKLLYKPTSSQLADGFTKGLAQVKFVSFRSMLRIS